MTQTEAAGSAARRCAGVGAAHGAHGSASVPTPFADAGQMVVVAAARRDLGPRDRQIGRGRVVEMRDQPRQPRPRLVEQLAQVAVRPTRRGSSPARGSPPLSCTNSSEARPRPPAIRRSRRASAISASIGSCGERPLATSLLRGQRAGLVVDDADRPSRPISIRSARARMRNGPPGARARARPAISAARPGAPRAGAAARRRTNQAAIALEARPPDRPDLRPVRMAREMACADPRELRLRIGAAAPSWPRAHEFARARRG